MILIEISFSGHGSQFSGGKWEINGVRTLAGSLGRCGGLVIASLLTITGPIGGVGGLIENVAYTEDVPLVLILAHAPEVVVQALLFGYLLLWWQRKVESKMRREASSRHARTS